MGSPHGLVVGDETCDPFLVERPRSRGRRGCNPLRDGSRGGSVVHRSRLRAGADRAGDAHYPDHGASEEHVTVRMNPAPRKVTWLKRAIQRILVGYRTGGCDQRSCTALLTFLFGTRHAQNLRPDAGI